MVDPPAGKNVDDVNLAMCQALGQPTAEVPLPAQENERSTFRVPDLLTEVRFGDPSRYPRHRTTTGPPLRWHQAVAMFRLSLGG